MSSQLVPITAPMLPALVGASGDRAGVRFLEFFAAQIRNPHTRRAYARAVGEFLAWSECVGLTSLASVQPLARRDLDRGSDAPGLGPDRQAAARRRSTSVRLARDRPGGAGKSGSLSEAKEPQLIAFSLRP